MPIQRSVGTVVVEVGWTLHDLSRRYPLHGADLLAAGHVEDRRGAVMGVPQGGDFME